jgi:hypothetical protein
LIDEIYPPSVLVVAGFGVKVNGVSGCVYREIDQYGQVIDVTDAVDSGQAGSGKLDEQRTNGLPCPRRPSYRPAVNSQATRSVAVTAIWGLFREQVSATTSGRIDQAVAQ